MSTRFLIEMSHPRIVNHEMLVATFIRDWNKDQCFYYPVYQIDNKALMTHVLLKFSGDESVTVFARANINSDTKDFEKLQLKNWDFIQI